MAKAIFDLKDEEATVAFGCAVGRLLSAPSCVYLLGDLGAGKTTLTRGILRAFGHQGVVKSPTYTLIETYDMPRACVHHMDLYRLSDPEELEFMGFRDLLEKQPIFLVEWPQRGDGWLMDADVTISLVYKDIGRQVIVDVKDKKWLDKIQISPKL